MSLNFLHSLSTSDLVTIADIMATDFAPAASTLFILFSFIPPIATNGIVVLFFTSLISSSPLLPMIAFALPF